MERDKISGIKKIRSYLLEFIKSGAFQKSVLDMREKYGIPSSGLPILVDEKYIKEKGIFYIPTNWVYFGTEDQLSQKRNFQYDIKKILDKFPLESNGFWKLFFIVYVFHDYALDLDVNNFLLTDNLCKLVDAKEELKEYEGWEDTIYLDKIIKDLEKYPILIKISPYASKRDIDNFIKSLLPLIKHYQSKYKSVECKLGKIRSKNIIIQRRNDFIYKNKDLPRKEVMKMVNKKFNCSLGYEDVNKIVSLEDKKRK